MYEGRGWGLQGAHARHYNHISLGRQYMHVFSFDCMSDAMFSDRLFRGLQSSKIDSTVVIVELKNYALTTLGMLVQLGLDMWAGLCRACIRTRSKLLYPNRCTLCKSCTLGTIAKTFQLMPRMTLCRNLFDWRLQI